MQMIFMREKRKEIYKLRSAKREKSKKRLLVQISACAENHNNEHTAKTGLAF